MIEQLIGMGLAALLFSFAFLVIALGIVFIKLMWSDE